MDAFCYIIPRILQARTILAHSRPIYDRLGRCLSFFSNLKTTVDAAMNLKMSLPRQLRLLPRQFPSGRPILTTSAKVNTKEAPGSCTDSLSVKTPARSSSRYHSAQVTSKPNKAIARMGLNPHDYTSGRWLHCNKEQIQARYIEFDFDALCRKVVEHCPGSKRIAQCKKIEGGFNRVFLFIMDDEQTLLARLPFSIAGPPRLVTHSEVATIAYSRLSPHFSLFSPLGSDFMLIETRLTFVNLESQI